MPTPPHPHFTPNFVRVNFSKKPEKLCRGDGHKWTFLFLGIFGNTLKILKICSQFSKKYVKKHAVPKCITWTLIFGTFFMKNMNLLQWNFWKKSENLCSGDGQKWTFLFSKLICDWHECRFLPKFWKFMQRWWSQMDIVDSVDKPLTTTA